VQLQWSYLKALEEDTAISATLFCAGCIARGSGFVLNTCFTILLNPINRTLMDWLCCHRINTIVPINKVIYFHVGIAMLACVASLFHGVGALT
jgi:hypothetical protein